MLFEKPKFCKTLWLVRGVSGAGKSTVADLLQYYLPSGVRVEADDYRYIDGEYAWDKVPNSVAHSKCKNAVRKAVEDGMHNIIVANTSTRTKDVNWYKNYCQRHGLRFISLIVENHHETGNVHGVPYEKLCQMESDILRSIKLK